MSVLIACAIIFILASVIAVLLKREVFETLFLSVAIIIGILYGFGLINRPGALLYGLYFIVILAILSLGFLVKVFIKERDSWRKISFHSALLVFLGLMCVATFFNYGRSFVEFDELTHWGLTTKHMFYTNALATVPHPNINIAHPFYLPMFNLFQYFVSRFSLAFREVPSFLAMNILYFTLILPFVKGISEKGKRKINLLKMVVFLCIPLLLDANFYTWLIVDGLMGAIFGTALLLYFIEQQEMSWFKSLAVSAALFLLTLSKDLGILFALAVIGVIGIDLLVFRREKLVLEVKREKSLARKIKLCFQMLLPLIVVGIAHFSWYFHLARLAMFRTDWEVPGVRHMLQLMSGNLEELQRTIRLNFLVAMFWREMPGIGLSTITFVIFFVVLIFVLAFIHDGKEIGKRLRLAAGILVLGLFGYLLVLATLYAFVFVPREALALAGFNRYVSSYITGLLFLSLSFFLSKEDELLSGRKVYNHAIAIVLLLLLSYNVIGNVNQLVLERLKNPRIYRPRITADAWDYWQEEFIDRPPLLIDQGSRGYSVVSLAFDLAPHGLLANRTPNRTPMEGGDYSISPYPYFGDQVDDNVFICPCPCIIDDEDESDLPNHRIIDDEEESVSPYLDDTDYDDVWTFIVSPEEWEQYIIEREIETIFIFRSDDILEDYFGHFFQGGVQENMLYTVNVVNGVLMLEPVR